MEGHFTTTSHAIGRVRRTTCNFEHEKGIRATGQTSYQVHKGAVPISQGSLRHAFGSFSFEPRFNVFPPSCRGFQSVPASCSTSRSASVSSSRASSGQNTPSISRQQSFTFTPPSWQDASFVAWNPRQAIPRLERSISTPKLPHQRILEEADYYRRDMGSGVRYPAAAPSPVAEMSETAMPVRREPCIVGWDEVEYSKATTFSSGRKVYSCTYCNTPLRRVKNYIMTWTKILFCQDCKSLPQCNACNKKAVPFIYTDANGLRRRVEPLCNFGGLNICGQCALINPVTERSVVLDLVKRARDLLQKLFAVKFTEQLLDAHTKPEVIMCLETMRLAGDSNGPYTMRVDSEISKREPSVLRKTSSGEVAELPFDIGPVWHIQLSQDGNQNVYGRCESRALTFPPLLDALRADENAGKSPRTYRVVQRIMLSRGMPEGLIYGHLIHELLHAFIWLFLDSNSVMVDLAAEEGLCNCILAAAIQQRVEALQARREAVRNALLRIGVKPKTNPGEKEVKGIPQTAEFLKALVEREAYSVLAKEEQTNTELLGGAQQTGFCLEYQLYVTEYELKVLNRRLGEMEKDSDAAYGVGYRTIRELAMSLTVVRLIEILGRHGEKLSSVVRAAAAV
ncbi:uncharacterized protein LOC34623590 [Cyclospora cayetanensis]|uniref:Uncharacterized protein n=2 Tax=Cyclospora cayetanensis TaxID=88456 RepID=A0A1D3CWJ6_9EIME|nr:uncharacterized protein LOC34623590 [Cyclospora cayetanensis]OEH75570.1 hypothetical protein cyc_07665 [Cyclospora cayetanensis]